MTHFIDALTLFADRLLLKGWLLDRASVASFAFVAPGIPGGRRTISSYGQQPSADIESVYGPRGEGARFDEVIEVDPVLFFIHDAHLEVRGNDGHVEVLRNLGLPVQQLAAGLSTRLWATLAERPYGHVPDIGSRARSGIVRRDKVPPAWSYTGVDVMAGPNVDVVGDAHELSAMFPKRRFDAIYAASVLEHLLMPWKFVTELNRVLNVGAVGLFTTHQCRPMRDMPWDFWRFSG